MPRRNLGAKTNPNNSSKIVPLERKSSAVDGRTEGSLPRTRITDEIVLERLLRYLQDAANRSKTNGQIRRDFPDVGTHRLERVLQSDRFQNESANKCDFHTWMSPGERKLYVAAGELAKSSGVGNLTTSEVLKHSGLSHSAVTHLTHPSEAFANQLGAVGIYISRAHALQRHGEVEYIQNAHERRKYLIATPLIDTRRLYPSFHENYTPSDFCTRVEHIPTRIRVDLCDFIEILLPTLAPPSLAKLLSNLIKFLELLFEMFPECDIHNLNRREHVIPLIAGFPGTQRSLCDRLFAGRRFLNFAVYGKITENQTLITDHDTENTYQINPFPIDPDALTVFDGYLIETVMPLLEQENDTPVVEPHIWDQIIVMRFAGLRSSDASRLRASDDPASDCIRFDCDGDVQLVMFASDAKNHSEHVAPLAFLNQTVRNSNPVVEAIDRQKRRASSLPHCVHGGDYLFRHHDTGDYSKLLTNAQLNQALTRIAEELDLRDETGQLYTFSSHQFRHTVACEMINNGVDVVAVQNFLGHRDIAKTQRYIKLLQNTVKTQLSKARSKRIYEPKWNNSAEASKFEQSDGCCDHPYKLGSCPAKSCKTCSRKKAYPRHVSALQRNAVVYLECAKKAALAGDTNAESRYKEIVTYSTKAIQAIREKGEFIAKTDYLAERRTP